MVGGLVVWIMKLTMVLNSPACIFIYRIHIANIDVCSDSDGAPQLEASSAVQRPTDLNEGEVWVEYHPASEKPPKILFSAERPVPAPTTVLPSKPSDESVPPWHPFKSRADFEQAELFLRFDVGDAQINAQLKQMVTDCPLGHSVTIRSAKEFHSILARIPDLEVMPEASLSCSILDVVVLIEM
jgi:hypothetical protein